jgi:hypothetical protein
MVTIRLWGVGVLFIVLASLLTPVVFADNGVIVIFNNQELSGEDIVVNPVNVTEGSVPDTYSLLLSERPQSGEVVTITIARTNEQITLNGNLTTTLLFDRNNWNSPQIIWVEAVDDGYKESTIHTSVITHVVSSNLPGSDFNTVTIDNITVYITDNDKKIRIVPDCTVDSTKYAWRFRNENSTEETVFWRINGSTLSGTITPPANGYYGREAYLYTPRSAGNTMIASVNGVQQDVKASNPSQCSDPITFSLSDSVAGENSGQPHTIDVKLGLANVLPVTATVLLTSSDGSAVEGVDYEFTPQQLVFAAGTGNDSRPITVTIIPDTTADYNHTFNVVLTYTDGLTDYLGNLHTHTVSINDAPILDLSSNSAGFNHTALYTPTLGAVPITDMPIITDTDDITLTMAEIVFTGRPDGNAELLLVETAGTSISATYDLASGGLSLTGTDTITNYQQVIQSVEYSSTLDVPSQGGRVIRFTVYDTLNQGNTTQTTLFVTAQPAPGVKMYHLPIIQKDSAGG